VPNENAPVLLSIAIPTHHGRFECLQQAITSILDQLTLDLQAQVRICVSDNASQDGTWEWLQQCAQQHPELFILRRNLNNIGAVPNILQVVSMAESTYCWFLSSDDQLAIGSIARVAQLLNDFPGITGITVNRINMGHDMRSLGISDPQDILPDNPKLTHIYTTTREILVNLGIFFTYFSAQIFRMDLWKISLAQLGVNRLSSYIFSHVLVLGTMTTQSPYWLWVPEQLVM
jgi:abequosyltransferase